VLTSAEQWFAEIVKLTMIVAATNTWNSVQRSVSGGCQIRRQ
jgi:hypothetical protein